MNDLPLIDISPLASGGDASLVASEISRASRDVGFFYIVGHGVSTELQSELEELSREFFALSHDAKMAIAMEHGGRAWRGFFPVGAELTKGLPDQKEGIYFGSEIDANHPKVAAGEPLFGANLFPALPRFKETLLEYLDELTRVGHALMRGFALSLGLESSYFDDRYTRDPLILFRIFNYPSLPPEARASADVELWSVGEHTDYGLLTILRQDTSGGLEVKSRDGWIDARPIPDSFVCNLGDMLDRMTGGLYRSTPHRVRNPGDKARLSFPFFFDPNVDAEIRPIDPNADIVDDRHERWDGASVHEFEGTYGDYLLAKVSKVFPQLSRGMLE